MPSAAWKSGVTIIIVEVINGLYVFSPLFIPCLCPLFLFYTVPLLPHSLLTQLLLILFLSLLLLWVTFTIIPSFDTPRAYSVDLLHKIQPLLFLRSSEFLTQNYQSQFFPLTLPHGHSEIFSLGFIFHLLSCCICLAMCLDSTLGWWMGNPYNTPLLRLPHLLLYPFLRVHSPLSSSAPWPLISFVLGRWKNEFLSRHNYLVHSLTGSWASLLSLHHQ